MKGQHHTEHTYQNKLNGTISRIVKRTFDLIASTFFLCLFFPFIFIIVAILIKTTTRGPIIFKQKRTGQQGKEFFIYKFRTMEKNDEADFIQATSNDCRTTKVGNFLRKTSIDEIPQFINVFLGDMSLVGPRPHMIKHTEEYSQLVPDFSVRQWVKPGITGWAQVTGLRGEIKSTEHITRRVQADIWYIEHWSFLLDLRILFMTVANTLRGDEEAY